MVAMAAGPSFQDIVHALLSELLHLNIIDPRCCGAMKTQINAAARIINAQGVCDLSVGETVPVWIAVGCLSCQVDKCFCLGRLPGGRMAVLVGPT